MRFLLLHGLVEAEIRRSRGARLLAILSRGTIDAGRRVSLHLGNRLNLGLGSRGLYLRGHRRLFRSAASEDVANGEAKCAKNHQQEKQPHQFADA